MGLRTARRSPLDDAADPAAVLETLPGFSIEHVLRADRNQKRFLDLHDEGSEGAPAAGRTARPADHSRDAR